MNTVNGNFIEKSIPDNSDATINVKIGNSDSTMNLVDFQTAMTPAPAYKVYTALLTQSGGSVPNSLSNMPLTIGVTYEIDDNGGSNWDFTNVGAPNNNVGTYFIATGTTPNSWGGENGNLYWNEGAPVVTVLENTIGNVWFTYSDAGDYLINSNSLFTTSKSIIFISANTADSYSAGETVKTRLYDMDTMGILSFAGGFQSDNILFNTPIEIRVYN